MNHFVTLPRYRCKPGFFNLDADNRYGCLSCFCYGHSSICSSAAGFGEYRIKSNFESGSQKWLGTDRDHNDIPTDWDNYEGVLGITAPSTTAVYFLAPERFLGDQRFSYGQTLDFSLRLDQPSGVTASIMDLVLEGDGQSVSLPIYAQVNGLNLKPIRL